jgi:SAM-dependent methyltransferase
MARVDYERMAADYERGRGLSDDALSGWRAAIARHLPEDATLIVDVGSGTGVFAAAMARWFGVEVIGVEPAAGMRSVARREHAHHRVAYVGGDAQRLPLRDASCDVAWLSTVIHHIPDLRMAAAEVARVLRPNGAALIRSSFPGRHDGITLFRYFPGAARIASSFPTVEETAAAFGEAGFALSRIESVQQVTAPSLAAAVERVRLRADTTLRLLSDEEFADGLRKMQEAADAAQPEPVVDRLDLLVFARGET